MGYFRSLFDTGRENSPNFEHLGRFSGRSEVVGLFFFVYACDLETPGPDTDLTRAAKSKKNQTENHARARFSRIPHPAEITKFSPDNFKIPLSGTNAPGGWQFSLCAAAEFKGHAKKLCAKL